MKGKALLPLLVSVVLLLPAVAIHPASAVSPVVVISASPLHILPDGVVTITICPVPADCTYPFTIPKTGLTITGAEGVEWINSDPITLTGDLGSQTKSLDFGTGKSGWQIECYDAPIALPCGDIGSSGCDGYAQVTDFNIGDLTANTHCTGNYTLVVETDEVEAPENKIGTGACGVDEICTFQVTSPPVGVPEFNLPVVLVSAIAFMGIVLLRMRASKTKLFP